MHVSCHAAMHNVRSGVLRASARVPARNVATRPSGNVFLNDSFVPRSVCGEDTVRHETHIAPRARVLVPTKRGSYRSSSAFAAARAVERRDMRALNATSRQPGPVMSDDSDVRSEHTPMSAPAPQSPPGVLPDRTATFESNRRRSTVPSNDSTITRGALPRTERVAIATHRRVRASGMSDVILMDKARHIARAPRWPGVM